jgi:carbon-monoxide dehydrogenase small subunit
MLVAAADLVERRPTLDRDAIREHLSGNYCRCTGYQAIVDAVVTVCANRLGQKEAAE